MTARRILTKRLRDPGSERVLVLCTPLTHPPAPGGRDDNDADWVPHVLSSSGNGSLAAPPVRWLSLARGVGGGGR